MGDAALPDSERSAMLRLLGTGVLGNTFFLDSSCAGDFILYVRKRVGLSKVSMADIIETNICVVCNNYVTYFLVDLHNNYTLSQ